MKKRADHTWPKFFRSTIAAQIHLAAFFAAVAGFGILIVSPSIQGGDFLACSIFVFLGAAVMGVSSFYHFAHDGFVITPELESILEKFDHTTIYLFIAGTYTPFLMNAVTSRWQLPLLIGVWCCAFLGILYTGFKAKLPGWAQSRAVYTGLFVIMGWVLVLRIGEITSNLSRLSLTLLIIGAFSYSLGALVYVLKKPDPWPKIIGYHELWHLAVAFGFLCHFCMMLTFYE